MSSKPICEDTGKERPILTTRQGDPVRDNQALRGFAADGAGAGEVTGCGPCA